LLSGLIIPLPGREKKVFSDLLRTCGNRVFLKAQDLQQGAERISVSVGKARRTTA
jgi:hypothetical protein